MSLVSLFTGAASFTIFFRVPEEAGFLAAHSQDGLDVHGTFDALLLDLAAQFIRCLDVAAVLDVIGMAAAAAEELGPAVNAFRLAEYMIHTEIMHHLHVLQAFIYIADHIAFTAYELVAWVNIAIRDDGQIFVACSASSESLRQARAFPEIHIEVEEEERSSFFR